MARLKLDSLRAEIARKIIIECRQQLGLSQERFVEALTKVNDRAAYSRYYQKVESGKNTVNAIFLKNIAEALMRFDPPIDIINKIESVLKTGNITSYPDVVKPIYLGNEFIGRDNQISTLSNLISENKLVLLFGAGGIGKTRLAYEFAKKREMQGHQILSIDFSNISLFPSNDVSPLMERINKSLKNGLPGASNRFPLLILDNCENNRDFCLSLITSLQMNILNLRIIATSREKFVRNLGCELRVPPLSLSSSIEMFVKRLRSEEGLMERSVPSKSTNEANEQINIREICKHLDGMPLAIEIAASQAVPLSDLARLIPTNMLGFQFIDHGDSRHNSVRAALEWSYKLLNKEEKLLFKQLAIFKDGWTLNAAEQICNIGANMQESFFFDFSEPELREPTPEIAVANQNQQFASTLTNLVKKSLVIFQNDRYRFLHPIHNYAHEHLLENHAEYSNLKKRHLDYYFQLSSDWESLFDVRQAEQLKLLNIEEGNLDAALRATIEGDAFYDRERSLRFVMNLNRFWEVREDEKKRYEYYSACLNRLEDYVDSPECEDQALTMLEGYVWGGWSAMWQQNLECAKEWELRSLKINSLYQQKFPALNSRLFNLEVDAMNILGMITLRLSDIDASESYFNQALHQNSLRNNKEKMAYNLSGLGDVCISKNELCEAITFFRQAQQINHEESRHFSESNNLLSIGKALLSDGQISEAIQELKAANEVAEAKSLHSMQTTSLEYLGKAYLLRGEYDHSMESYVGALKLFSDVNNHHAALAILQALIRIAVIKNDFRRAVALVGYIDSNKFEGNQLGEETELEVDTNEIRKGLSLHEFEEIYRRGGALAFDSICKLAAEIGR